ncbi:MAG: hypothetical protein ACP5RZ_04730 [Thermoplasmata archaeon]
MANTKVSEENNSQDWFSKLDATLNKKTEEILKTVSQESGKKRDINITLIQDLWKIYQKFNDMNIHFKLEPEYTKWATFVAFPHNWKIKEDFNFDNLNNISFIDTTRDQGRTGDALKVNYYNAPEGERIRIVFEYSEGEQYFKYSGWKRIYVQYILFDKPLSETAMEDIHNLLFDLVVKWYESHLRKDRNIILDYITKNFPKGETFSE